MSFSATGSLCFRFHGWRHSAVLLPTYTIVVELEIAFGADKATNSRAFSSLSSVFSERVAASFEQLPCATHFTAYTLLTTLSATDDSQQRALGPCCVVRPRVGGGAEIVLLQHKAVAFGVLWIRARHHPGSECDVSRCGAHSVSVQVFRKRKTSKDACGKMLSTSACRSLTACRTSARTLSQLCARSRSSPRSAWVFRELEANRCVLSRCAGSWLRLAIRLRCDLR